MVKMYTEMFYFARKTIWQVCQPINRLFFAAIITPNKSWTAFEQSTINKQKKKKSETRTSH